MLYHRIQATFHRSFEDEEYRQRTLFILLHLILGNISAIMTIVNLFTHETTLMWATFVTAMLCALNIVFKLTRCMPKWLLNGLFSAEAMVILGFFIYSGHPQGFSVLWCLVIPSFALSIFGIRGGIILCGVLLAMILFFFWLPLGQSLLQYDYGATFRLRFPFVYICMVCLATYLETIRRGTYTKLKENEHNYRHMYQHDALTGLYGRHAFYEQLDHILQHHTNEHTAVLMLDIDDFKSINDQYGHNVGDGVLRQVAKIIQDETCEHCICCRWGGEEFLVLMQCRHDPMSIAENIRKQVEATAIDDHGHRVQVTVSIGLTSTFTLERAQFDEFINQADKSLYHAKATGKNCVVVYKPE